jgi:hypothetical protein
MAIKTRDELKSKVIRRAGHDIFNPRTVEADDILDSCVIPGPVQSAAATDAAFYILNGTRGEVRSQTQGSIAADTGFTLELRNTSVAADSLIVANVIGGNGGIVSGSVVSANVIGANTASLNFFNTGTTIVDNATFTASFAIL